MKKTLTLSDDVDHGISFGYNLDRTIVTISIIIIMVIIVVVDKKTLVIMIIGFSQLNESLSLN